MGDVTSGGVQDDAAANADISGGGGGGSSSNYSYSDLGQSPGAMGGRPDPTPVPVVQSSNDYFTPMNDQPISGQGPVNTFSRYLQDLGKDFFGGGTQTDDRGSSGADVGAVSVNDNQFNQGLASLTGTRDASPMSDFPSYMSSPRAGTDTDTTMAALRRGAPALMASNAAEEAVQTAVAPPKFMFDYGFGTAGSPQSPEDFRREEEKIASMTGGARNIIDPLQTLYQRGFTPVDDRERPSPTEMTDFITPILPTPAAKPSVIDTQPKADANAAAAKLASLARSGGAKTKEELNLVQRFGRFLQGLGKGISNFQMSDIFEFLKGDPNYKGPSAAQQQLMGVPGPGPFVGGGVPSPSDGGGMAAPAKDPCPPGFRFDPTLQQCVPIIAPNTPTDTTTTPTTPTTPAPGTSPPAAGGIANAYPFVLTPPIGAPVGNLPPVRLTT